MKKLKNWAKTNITNQFVKFLQQGLSSKELALTISLGFCLAVFPIIGTHTALSLLVIYFLRLNPAAFLIISNLCFPLFFLLIFPFFQLGLVICNANENTYSFEYFSKMMDLGLINVIQTLGKTLVFAVVGWLIFCIPIGILIYFISYKIVLKIYSITENRKPMQ